MAKKVLARYTVEILVDEYPPDDLAEKITEWLDVELEQAVIRVLEKHDDAKKYKVEVS